MQWACHGPAFAFQAENDLLVNSSFRPVHEVGINRMLKKIRQDIAPI